MTAALADIEPPEGGWTTDDLDRLPEDGRRRELIDGVLIVSPSPTNIHQVISARLVVALEESCPPEYEVTQAVEVRASKRRSFIPDVLVTTAEAAARGPHWFLPHEVLLAVEIVSPSSVTLDRVAKPALYAEAGIPYYWRVETDGGIAAHTYRIDPSAGVYLPTGEHTEAVETDQPWALTIPMARLTPRFLR